MKQRPPQSPRSLFARKNRPLPTVRRFRQSRFEALESRRVRTQPLMVTWSPTGTPPASSEDIFWSDMLISFVETEIFLYREEV